MKKNILDTLNIQTISEEEISEIVFRKLINKEKFLFLFTNTSVFYHILTDKEFRNNLNEVTLIISSKFLNFVISKLNNTKNSHTPKESSCIFRILKTISDYHYRILVIEKSNRIVSRFKKNINSSIRGSSLNIIGTYNTWNQKNRAQKIETLKKIEPDITIIGNNVVKFIKMLKKDNKTFNSSSFIFSTEGLKVIAGTRRKGFFGILKLVFETGVILFWFLFQKISHLIRK